MGGAPIGGLGRPGQARRTQNDAYTGWEYPSTLLEAGGRLGSFLAAKREQVQSPHPLAAPAVRTRSSS
eukprot:12891963-Prorocentrum_lima.AAC.1